MPFKININKVKYIFTEKIILFLRYNIKKLRKNILKSIDLKRNLFEFCILLKGAVYKLFCVMISCLFKLTSLFDLVLRKTTVL